MFFFFFFFFTKLQLCFSSSPINAKKKFWGVPHLLHMCVIFLIIICFSSSSINAKKKFWGVPHLLHMCVIFVLWGCFNCWWLRGGEVGKKVLFRDSWNCIFCLLLWLKSQTVRGASGHPAFMILVLIKGMRRGDESKILFCHPRSLRAFLQTYYKWGGLI